MAANPKSTLRLSALGERASAPTIARLMRMALETPGLLSLSAGFTDNRTLPVRAVNEAVEALARGGDPEALQYGTNQGRPGLRKLLAERLAASEPALNASQLAESTVVTNGSQQALYLAMQVLCEPGDIVLVDRPSYFVFLEMLTGLGVHARSLPVDSTGRIDVDALSDLLDRMTANGEVHRLRAVYFVSYFSNPSARSLSATEKQAIARQLAQRGLFLPVLEDAAYRDLYFDAPAAAPSVLSLEAWDRFPKLYLSTLTKSFATGLKVGYGICSDRTWLEKILHVKGCHDFGTNHFAQTVLEHVLKTGGFDAQLAVIRPAYRNKMQCLHETLTREGLREAGWRWEVPEGGLYLWLSAPQSFDTSMDSDFCRACLARGVLYVPGDLCFGDDAPKNHARLSFGVLSEADLKEAGRRFARAAAG